MDQTLKLHVYRLGDSANKIMPVTVPLDTDVGDLITKIQERYFAINKRSLDSPTLYKCDYDMKGDLPKAADQSRDQEMPPTHTVRKYWPDSNSVDPKRFHVLVIADFVGYIPPEMVRDSLDHLPEGIRKLELQRRKTVEYFRNLGSSLAAAHHSSFVRQLHEINLRPGMGLPIQLLHPVFDHFLQGLETPHAPAPFECENIYKLACAAQDSYYNDAQRWCALKICIQALLGANFSEDRSASRRPGGLIGIMRPDTRRSYFSAIVEVNSDIKTQAGTVYHECWDKEQAEEIYLACACPSLIIAITGPWMCVFGAVYMDGVVIQPLTEFVYLGQRPAQDSYMRLARMFHALKTSIAELSTYYEALLDTLPEIPKANIARFFPYVREYEDAEGKTVKLTYSQYFAPLKTLCVAETDLNQEVVVKFTQDYNIEAHRLLASKGLAPAVLFYRKPLYPGGFHIVITELVESETLHEWFGSASGELYSIKYDVKTAMDTLHEHGWVFGDLRPPNVLVIERGDKCSAMLVDFEWCGEEGKARYPMGINRDESIPWHEDAQRGGLIEKAHDWHMFEMLFRE